MQSLLAATPPTEECSNNSEGEAEDEPSASHEENVNTVPQSGMRNAIFVSTSLAKIDFNAKNIFVHGKRSTLPMKRSHRFTEYDLDEEECRPRKRD